MCSPRDHHLITSIQEQRGPFYPTSLTSSLTIVMASTNQPLIEVSCPTSLVTFYCFDHIWRRKKKKPNLTNQSIKNKQKTKNRPTITPISTTPGNLPKNSESAYHRRYLHINVYCRLFTIAKVGSLSVSQWDDNDNVACKHNKTLFFDL